MNKVARAVVSTADIIATCRGRIVLIKRKKFPFDLALPGGHVELGEQPEDAAVRELKEETGLFVESLEFFTKRSGSKRDPRYNMSKTRVYIGLATGKIRNEAGHTEVVLFTTQELKKIAKERFAFDHYQILIEYLKKH